MSNKQSGFSLVEMLLVLVILGIISTIAIPYLLKAIHRSEETSIYATMKTMAGAQVNHFSSKGRFGRLDELNSIQANGLGTVLNSGEMTRGKFFIQMAPLPTDDELKQEYSIIVTRAASATEPPLTLSMNQSGKIVGIFDDF